METWKDIQGWEGLYQVSSYGRLKSFKGDPAGRILKNTNKKGGYFSVVLQAKNRRPRYCRMHRLVAEAFIPNPLKKTAVNHIDCNKQNNHVKNLEWATPSENSLHAAKFKPSMIYGMNEHNKKLRPRTVLQFTLSGELLGVFPNAKAAGRATGVCSRNIHQVASKTEYKPGMVRSQAGGFRWEFKEESQGNADPYFNIGQR